MHRELTDSEFQRIERALALAQPLVAPVEVVIIDDSVSEIEGIQAVLERWPEVRLTTFLIQRRVATLPVAPPTTQVVLLDHIIHPEDIRLPNGYHMAQALEQSGCKAVIGSISRARNQPAYAKRQFRWKLEVLSDDQSAREFVQFMNALIEISRQTPRAAGE